jgi:exopolyphosphatase / guanosine-5'-triphosphate,3'-diphosphate pyrophosphatase
MPRVLAAADIGSNTAHLLVAATDGGLVMRMDNVNEWIPLGEIVARKGEIPKDLVTDLVLAATEFRRTAVRSRAERLYVFATEGMRRAKNHAEVLKKIEKEGGVKVEIISPAREAELSFLGVMLDTRVAGADLVFEVGGGSLQIGRVVDGKLAESESLPLGTGKIIAESGLTNPAFPDAIERAEAYVDEVLSGARINLPSRVAVASGGVARGLWRALHPDGEKELDVRELDHLAWSAARLSVDRLVARFNVKPKRAGTLLPGAIVYRALLRRYSPERLIVSEFGVREGAVLEMARDAKLGERV